MTCRPCWCCSATASQCCLNDGGDPWQETLRFAELLADRSIPALVLDTETGYLRLGRARQLANALGAEYLTLEELSQKIWR